MLGWLVVAGKPLPASMVIVIGGAIGQRAWCLDKLVALGLIRRYLDANSTQIAVHSLPKLLVPAQPITTAIVRPDAFYLRSDAVPITNLLASNDNCLNANTDAIPYRIANILRDWASQYSTGMQLLRRCDNRLRLNSRAMVLAAMSPF